MASLRQLDADRRSNPKARQSVATGEALVSQSLEVGEQGGHGGPAEDAHWQRNGDNGDAQREPLLRTALMALPATRHSRNGSFL